MLPKQNQNQIINTPTIPDHVQLDFNKTVLLRERKRHTDRHVVSGRGGTPSLAGGVPHPWLGVPQAGVPPIWTWLGYPLSGPGWGTPRLDLARYPPSGPGPGWGTLPLSEPDWGTPHLDLTGIPPPPIWT